MAAQEFHHFPQIPELVKVIVLKKLDLETLLSFALTAKNSAKLVRECRLTPSLVEIRMEEVKRDRHYQWNQREKRKKVCRIDVSFESGTFPEGYNCFTWNFVESSSEFIKYVQHVENLDEPTYVYDKFVLDDGAVLNNLYQIEQLVGCEVTPQNFDKVYSRIEDFLLKELFLPAKKVEVMATEGVVSDLGDAFAARNKLRVDELTLEEEWKKTETLERILEGYQVDKLVIGRKFSVDCETVNWNEISAPARAVIFSKSNLFEAFGVSALFPFHFQRAKIERCDLKHFFLIVRAWLHGFECMDQLSFLTVELRNREENGFRHKLQECLRPSWTFESVQNKFITQTDSANKVVRVFQIETGFELMNEKDGARAFCWHFGEGDREDQKIAQFLVWSSKYSEMSEEKGRQFIEERKRELERIIEEQDSKYLEEQNQRYSKTRKLHDLVKNIKEHQVEIKEAQKRIEAYDILLQNASKVEEEEHQEEEMNPVDEQEFDDIEIIQKCLEHHSESSELAKLAPLYEFTLLTEHAFGGDERQRKFEIQIKNTAKNKEMAIKFQYIAQLDKFEVFLNETQLGKSALTGIRLRRAPNNQYCDRLREKACREIWLRLQTLFPSAEFSLTLSTSDRKRMPVLFRAQKKHSLKCTHVRLVGDWRGNALEKTMKCLEVTKTIEFSWDFEVKKMPSEMPFVDEIVIIGYHSSRRSFPSWTPKCREIRVENANDLMHRFLREVISDWKAGKLCSTFESMLVQSRDLNNEDPQQKFLEEFQGKSWDPSQRSGVFWKLSDSQEMVCHNLLEGLDFQRSSDGSLATLLTSADYHYNFKFIVWKKGEEFKAPRAKDVEKLKTLDIEKLEQLQNKLADMKKEAKVLRWQAHEEKKNHMDSYWKYPVADHDILDD